MHIDLDRALKSGVEETRTTQSRTHTHAIDLANSLEVSTRSERCETEKHRNTAASRSRRLHPDSLLKQIRRSITRAIQQKQPDRKIFNLFTTLIAGTKEESR